MKYLITGGEFNNKGAEAMTLAAIENIVDVDKQAVIHLLDGGEPKPFSFPNNIVFLKCPPDLFSILNNKKVKMSFFKKIKDFLKIFVPTKFSLFGSLGRIKKIMKRIDVMIDVSGYQLSSKWGEEISIKYCDRIDVLKKYGAKVYLMPQSFGPFDYSDQDVFKLVKTSLAKCDGIFAREKNGMTSLKAMGLSNFTHCYDSVLINKYNVSDNVLKNYKAYIESFDIRTTNNVAIIPNFRLIDKAGLDYDSLIDFYCHIIKTNKNFSYYLIAHAGEDLKICRDIKKRFASFDGVHLIDHVLLSFNYQNLIRMMDFIIASRYHAIIHAYKECTPALILGWSPKYDDIAELFEQKDYILNVFDLEKNQRTIERMIDRRFIEREKIKKCLTYVKTFNCYSFLKELNGNK